MKFKRTSRDEISKLVTTARTYSQDARVESLSPATKFQLAYESARMWCEIAIRAEGQRITSRLKHHEKVIRKLIDIIGPEIHQMVNYLWHGEEKATPYNVRGSNF